jgi:sugar phosphate isomerase/epimerase
MTPPDPRPSPRLGIIGIVNAELDADLPGTLRRLAALGYAGVEVGEKRIVEAGGPERLAGMLADAGLELITLMVMREPLRDRLAELRAACRALRCRFLTVPWAPLDTLEAVKADAQLYTDAGLRLRDDGVQLCYHHHEHELLNRLKGGQTALDCLLAETRPEALALHLDAAWATFGRVNPVSLLERYSGRVPLVHLKDLYDLELRGCFTCPGTGLVDLAGVIHASRRHGVSWLTVEQDTPRRIRGFELAAAARHNVIELGF